MGLFDDFSAAAEPVNTFENIRKRQRIYFVWFLIILFFALFCAVLYYDNRLFLKSYSRQALIVFLAGVLNFTGLIIFYFSRKKLLKEKCSYCFAFNFYKNKLCSFCGREITVKEPRSPFVFKIFAAVGAVVVFVSAFWWHLRWYSVYSIADLHLFFISYITLESIMIVIMWFMAVLLFWYLFLSFKSKKYVYFILLGVAAVCVFIYNDYARDRKKFRINTLENYSLKTESGVKDYVAELIQKEKKKL